MRHRAYKYWWLVGLAGQLIACGPPPPPGVVYVERGPPPDRVEEIVTRPGNDYAWVRGHWRWTGDDYDWVPGHWAPIERGYSNWVPGHWVHSHGHGWFFVEGHWS
jgi:hypothetical protein